jgi:DNA modification methylase
MELIKKKVSELIPYINNSRTHSEEQITQIVSSIKEFGFTNPILIDKDNSIIAGHGRLQAVKRLGLEEVPCILISGLTKTQIKALIIADNQLALNAGWDLEKLSVEIEGLEEDKFDLNILGFEEDFLKDLLFKENEGLTDEDAAPDAPENPKSKPKDIWLLGSHKLICGDSTKAEDYKLLFKDNLADMIFTDPPYNVDYSGRGKNDLGKIINDNMDENKFVLFLDDVFKLMSDNLKPLSILYVCHPDSHSKPKIAFEIAFDKYFKKSSTLIWNKGNAGMGWQDYRSQHEPILYGWKEGKGKHNFYGDRTKTSIWNIKRDNTTEYKHPTQKPVELVKEAILNSSKEKDIIFDPFSGSGSTLIACEKLNRICYGIELDTKFVDVIIQRWQQFTGKEAIHEQSGKTYNSI